jgi:hypothetical protein
MLHITSQPIPLNTLQKFLWLSTLYYAVSGLFKKYPMLFFSAETNEARELCCGMKVEGTFMHLRGFFPHQQTASVACSQRVSESVNTARVAFVIFFENNE